MPDHSVQGSALSEAWVQTFDDSLERANNDSLERANNDRGEWKTDSDWRRLKLPPPPEGSNILEAARRKYRSNRRNCSDRCAVVSLLVFAGSMVYFGAQLKFATDQNSAEIMKLEIRNDRKSEALKIASDSNSRKLKD